VIYTERETSKRRRMCSAVNSNFLLSEYMAIKLESEKSIDDASLTPLFFTTHFEKCKIIYHQQREIVSDEKGQKTFVVENIIFLLGLRKGDSLYSSINYSCKSFEYP
jgi:hypothetical protein